MFFHFARYILYLKRQEIQIFDTKTKRFTLPVPETIINHLEVRDLSEYQTVLLSTFASLKIKNTSLAIILADEVLFHTKLTGVPDELDAFLKTVPFEAENIVLTYYNTKKESFVYATNRVLYEAIQQVALQQKVTLVAVIPAPIIPELATTPELEAKLLQKSLKHSYKKNGNFLLGTEVAQPEIVPDTADSPPDNQAPKTSKLKLFIFLPLSLLFLTAVLFYAAHSMGFLKNPLSKNVASKPSPQPSQAVKTQITPKEETPATKTVAKEDLTIEVLNGSGVSGHAGTVRNLLIESGFENVTTGNATASATATTIVFSPRVSEENQKEIEEILDTTSESTRSTIRNTEETDVIITTGTLKIEE